MPDICKSCGETAVIEVDLDGQGMHKICIECATVATENNTNVSFFLFTFSKSFSLVLKKSDDTLRWEY